MISCEKKLLEKGVTLERARFLETCLQVFMLSNALLVSVFKDLIRRLKLRGLYLQGLRVPRCVKSHGAASRGGAKGAFF